MSEATTMLGQWVEVPGRDARPVHVLRIGERDFYRVVPCREGSWKVERKLAVPWAEWVPLRCARPHPLCLEPVRRSKLVRFWHSLEAAMQVAEAWLSVTFLAAAEIV